MNKHVRERDGYIQVLEWTPGMRKLVADAIEALVLLLDEIDDDENLEETGDDELTSDEEPTMGSHHRENQSEWGATAFDAEDECEPDADGEPLHGSSEIVIVPAHVSLWGPLPAEEHGWDQEKWTMGQGDNEAEHDGCEADEG